MPRETKARIAWSRYSSQKVHLAQTEMAQTCLSGFENGLMQIRTERCPNESIPKQICHNFGRVYLGSKLPCPACSFASPRMYHPQRSATCRVKPSRAKRGPAARSAAAERIEAPPREARQAAEGGQHFDVSEPREGRQIKLGCDSAAATQLPRPNADSCFSGFVGTARPGFQQKRSDAGFSFSRLEELCS